MSYFCDFQLLWHHGKRGKLDYARPYDSTLFARANLRYLTARDDSTVALNQDSYVKKFMNAVGWMDQSRTVRKYLMILT